MRLKKIIIPSFCLLMIIACNKSNDKELDDQANKITLQKPTEHVQKLIKIASIDKSFNSYSVRAFEVYNDYINLFGSNANNMELDKIVNFSQIDDFQLYSLKHLDSAIALPVLKELNPLIRSYKINARAFAVTINSCNSYYSKKEYRNDKFNQAAVLHKLTINIYSKFKKSDSILRVKSKKLTQKIENEYLNTLKEEGLEVEYLMLVGTKDIDYLKELLASNSYNDLNVEKLTYLQDKISTTYNKLTELKNSDKNQFNQYCNLYYSNLEHLNQSINELIQRKKDKRKFTKDEIKKLKHNKTSARLVVGSIQSVLFLSERVLESCKDIKLKRGYLNSEIATKY